MSELKATPGPWTVSTWVEQPNNKCKPMVAAKGVTVAITHPSPLCREEECEANAHLIAAAPEMYEALEQALEVLPDGDCSNTKAQIEAALKKARGES